MQIYQGASYATAKANVGCSPAENTYSEDETRPGERGIVKTVEVDVESAFQR